MFEWGRVCPLSGSWDRTEKLTGNWDVTPKLTGNWDQAVYWELGFTLIDLTGIRSFRIISWDDQDLNWDWDLGEKLTGTWDCDPPPSRPP